jgi:hypothetical protein
MYERCGAIFDNSNFFVELMQLKISTLGIWAVPFAKGIKTKITMIIRLIISKHEGNKNKMSRVPYKFLRAKTQPMGLWRYRSAAIRRTAILSYTRTCVAQLENTIKRLALIL